MKTLVIFFPMTLILHLVIFFSTRELEVSNFKQVFREEILYFQGVLNFALTEAKAKPQLLERIFSETPIQLQRNTKTR